MVHHFVERCVLGWGRRIPYYARRVIEAGPRAAIEKAQQKIKPYVYWPIYAFGRSYALTDREERTSMLEFASKVRRSLASARLECCLGVISARENRYDAGIRVNVLGYGDVALPNGEAWHADAISGYRWQAVYFPFCDYVAARLRCDVKVPWELSRLHSLVELSFGVVSGFGAGASLEACRIFDCIDNWMEFNPPGYGPNWVCGMEVAIRAINIAFAAGALWSQATEEQRRRVCACLIDHRRYLRRFPEVSDVPGNHYLMDLLGEFVLDLCLDGEQSESARSSFTEFVEEAARQFDATGEHIERATVYQRLCFDAVALGLALAPPGVPVATDKLQQIVRAAWCFMERLASPTGRIPVFGDQDSGFVLWLGDDPRQLVDLRGVSTEGDSNFLRLLDGLAESAWRPKLSGGRPVAGQVGSYSTDEGSRFFTVCKGGRQGLQGRASHDHDDALSLWTFVDGRDFIVDAGSHSYTLSPAIRVESIVSSAHNSPRRFGKENWTPVVGSVTSTVRGAAAADVVSRSESECVGTLKLGDGVAFERRVRIASGQDDESLIVEDEWSDSPSGIEVGWLFAPSWVLEDLVPHESDDLDGVRCHFKARLSDGTATVFVYVRSSASKVDATVEQSRMSPVYGSFVQTTRLNIAVKGAASGALSIEFRIAR